MVLTELICEFTCQLLIMFFSSQKGSSGTYLSLSALFLIDLSWLMALLFSIDILAWLARISLLSLSKIK